MLREHFGALGKDSHKAKFSHEAIIMVLLAMYLPAWAGWLAGDWRCLVAVPLIGWFLMSNGAHDGSHFAASRSPTVNDLHACLSSPLYYTSANWCQQHVVSHHGETNILGVDVDLHHHPKDRMHPHQVHPGARVLSGLKNVGWHTISMFVSTFILSVVQPGLLFVVPHIKIALGIKLDARKGTGAGVAMTALMATSVKSGFGAVSGRFVLTTALWLTSMFVLLYPYWAFGLGLKGFAFSLMPYMISSILFMVVTQVSHIQKETQSDEVLDNADFFKRQALTSLDYSESSEVWRFLTGGLNVQSIHHVCPGVHSSHYTDLYPKFRAICQKHGCCPSSASNIGAALWRHTVYVYNLGEDFEACFTPEM